MNRHIVDQGHSDGKSARTQVYTLLDRARVMQDGHPKIRQLARRRRSAADTARLLQYLRIARRREA